MFSSLVGKQAEKQPPLASCTVERHVQALFR
jgi:hypothetical protein